MKYSKLDWVLVYLAFFQSACLLAWPLTLDRFGVVGHTLIFILQLALFYYNSIVITHNFLHTPFLKNSLMNKIFASFNSLNLGLPQILYRYHHLNHHKYNNTLKDPSSTKLYASPQREHEHWVTYCLFSLFREGTQMAYKEILKKGQLAELAAQVLVCLSFFTYLMIISPFFFFVFYVPFYILGWFLAHMENYFEHFHATDEHNFYANAVSYYGRIYNRLMFNEGYHQEHHLRPGLHWSKRPQVHKKFNSQMKKNKAYEAKYPPLLGFLDTGM